MKLLAQPLLAGRTIRVVPVAGFGEESGQVVQAAGDIEIRTRRLGVANCRFQSADREAVTIEFVFNQKVEPGELLRHLVLTDPAVKARNEKGEETILQADPTYSFIKIGSLIYKVETLKQRLSMLGLAQN